MYVYLVLHDNASNMEKAMRDEDLNSYGCFAHTLQLIVKDGAIGQWAVSNLLSVCGNIVGHFKCSTVKQRLDLPQHHMKQDEPNWCNSLLYILESIIEKRLL